MTESIRVLHVDDEPDFAEMAGEFLEREDERIEVVTASSARAGLDRLADTDVDCVVSDFEMPEMNGLEFLSVVRDRYPDLPFILFTGKGSEEVASDAISAGATDYLQKEGGTDQYTILANRVLNYVETSRASTQRHRLLRAIETAQEGVSILDEDGRFVFVNDAYADIYGYDPEEMVGEHWELLYPDEDVDYVRDEVLPEVEATGRWHGTTTGVRADGGLVREDHTLARTDNGGLVCTVRDVTGRKERGRALAALHDAATDLEAADSEGEVYEILVEAAEGILDFDLVAVDVLDDDREALVQRAWTLDLDTEGYYQETALDEDTFATRAFHSQDTIVVDDLREYEITPADPEYRAALTVPIEDIGTFQAVSRDEGAFDETDRELAELLVGHAREALQRLERERELRERSRELERQNDRLEEFATIVSHDLRTPLNVAEGRLELVREEHDDDQFEEIARALDRMATIINDTLTLARQGQMVTDREYVDLAPLATQCWGRIAASDSSLDVRDDTVVRADPDRLKQVFENLFRNAVEHGSTGSQAKPDDAVEHGSTNPRSQAHEDAVEHAGDGVTVTVGELDDGFYVADDGPGIPEERRDEVFDRGHTTSDDGTGFGLSIVREIVEAHGWEVAVTESDAGGARFEITGVET